MDRERMERGIREFVEGIGERFEGDDLERTPARVARAWVDDLVSGYATDPAAEVSWTPVAPGGGVVIVRDIRFASVCVHHLLPFHGNASIAYLPGERLAGLSKLGRVVDALSRRLQMQERLTSQIVDALESALEPRGVLAVLEACHTCMSLRGVRKEGATMLTSEARGCYRDDAALRAATEALLRGSSG